MSTGNLRRAAGAVAAVAILATLAPVAAHGAARGAAASELSPRLAALARPALRAAPPAVQARRLGVAVNGPGSLLGEGSRVIVDVRFDRGLAAGAEELRAAGAEIVHVSGRYRVVTAAARPAELPALAAVNGVGGVTEVLEPIVSAAECRGLVTSEGDAQLRASTAREGFAVDGSGVTVGILSDSFDRDPAAPTRAGADVLSGDLPGAGNPCGRTGEASRLDDSFGSGDATDEGRAMGQIVHDLAPGASLSFATAFNGLNAFAANIRRLVNAGADVIVDDVLYLEEPFFQEGPVAVAATGAAAAGIPYFSAAGNSNLTDAAGNELASWEAPAFRDTACPAELQLPPLSAEPCMDFDPGPDVDPSFELEVAAGATLTVDLQWAQPWNGVSADLDAFLLDSDDKPIEVGGAVVAGEDDNVGVSQRPVEVVQWENESGASRKVRLAITRCSGACNPAADPSAKPRLKFAFLQNGSGVTASEYPRSNGGDTVGPAIFGHAGSASAIAVGAVPFNDSSTAEPFSSRGPVTHYFGPVLGASPAPPTAPTQIPKPDLAATDGGASTFFGQLVAGVRRFFGTSAAAPHAAAVAALMRQANPALSLGQLRLALAATARPVATAGANVVGAGLVDAFAAVSSVALPPTVSITESPPALGRSRWPTFGFTASRPVAFHCSIDGGGLQPCSSPFAPVAPLSDGVHGFVVSGTDAAGRTGRSAVVAFKIDSKRPRAFFRKRPPRTIRTKRRRAKAVFRFGATERGVTFVCRVDGGLPRFCKRRLVKRFRVGKHVVRVRARDAAGNVSRRAAVHRFKVERRGRR